MRISDWSSDVCSSDLLAIGGSFVAFLTYGKNLWALILFQRSHGLSAGETGLMLGVTIGVAGIVGTWLGGYLADRFGSVDRRHMLTTPAIGQNGQTSYRARGRQYVSISVVPGSLNKQNNQKN